MQIKYFLLLLTLSFSTVFTFIPDIKHERYKPYNHEGRVIIIDTWALPLEDGYKDYFIFSEQKLTLETYLFFLFEHIILVMLALTLLINEKYISPYFIYFIIQLLDTLIYILAYGSLRFPSIPINWDFLKIFIFGLSVGIDTLRYRNSV